MGVVGFGACRSATLRSNGRRQMLPDNPISSASPREEYVGRLKALGEQKSEQQRHQRLAGYSQLLVGAIGVVWILLSVRDFGAWSSLLLIPVAIFIFLALLQERWIRSVRRCSRAIDFYASALRRLDGAWAGTGEPGDRFLDSSHPYSRDLDLFGKASLFELLCTARTRAGEETLAQWLLSPASLEEILRRQAAAAELKNRLDFRERLATFAGNLRQGLRPEFLIAWGEANSSFQSEFIRILAPLLAALWLFTVVCWGVWGRYEFLVLATVVNLWVSQRYRLRLGEAAHPAEEAGRDLTLLSEVLDAFEREPFVDPRLVELQNRLKREGTAPSVAIARLNRLVEFLESGHNLFVRPIDPVIFWSLQFVLAIESWRTRFGPALRIWIDTIGELEALLAVSAYAYEHPGDVLPEFVADGPRFEAAGLAHPLLPRESAVRNNIKLDSDLALMMLSGPNMAGKSTFLRGIGLSVVLAQMGAPVCAKKLVLSGLAVTASICILDSLQGGISRFYAEIKRLKQIVDLTGQRRLPVLFLLDELLSGTNSHDRFIGARSVVLKLMERGAVGLVTTHDLALTEIPAAIGPRALNFHFADHLENGELKFDYKLRPGVVETSNALQLMRSIGLEI
jgi:hypothetical protein